MTGDKPILVTGASGFIGAWIVETLYLRGYTRVRAGIRSWTSAARIARFPVEICLCDVMDNTQLAAACEGIDIIIHCAKSSRMVNVEGTRNVIDQARTLGVSRVVHLSTAEVYGECCGVIDETAPLKPRGDEYADSKIEAEKLCWESIARRVPITILRPSIVYGPFCEWWTVRFAERLQSGNWGIFKGLGEGFCNLVYVSDLVSAVLIAMGDEGAIGEAFNINGPERLTWNDYFKEFDKALGLPDLKEIQPYDLKMKSILIDQVRRIGNLMLDHYRDPIKKVYHRVASFKKLMNLTQTSVRTTPIPSEFGLFSRPAIYSDQKAQERLGFRPQFDMARGLQLSVSWLEHLGHLSGGP